MDDSYDSLIDQLTVIRGFTELLQEGTFGPLTPDQRRILGELVLEADELHVLLDRVGFPRDLPVGSTPDLRG